MREVFYDTNADRFTADDSFILIKNR